MQKHFSADFLENKINADRAQQLFGDSWREIISNATHKLKHKFMDRTIIFKTQSGRTRKGSITLGWKFKLLNVRSGILSGEMDLTHDQVVDIYSGKNLSNDKKNASVNGQVAENSGVANYILFATSNYSSAQEIVDSIITVDEYVNQNPDIYYACKAINYRTLEKKYDGKRPLAVYVDWFITEGQLDYEIKFDTPLEQGGDFDHLWCLRVQLALSAGCLNGEPLFVPAANSVPAHKYWRE